MTVMNEPFGGVARVNWTLRQLSDQARAEVIYAEQQWRSGSEDRLLWIAAPVTALAAIIFLSVFVTQPQIDAFPPIGPFNDWIEWAKLVLIATACLFILLLGMRIVPWMVARRERDRLRHSVLEQYAIDVAKLDLAVVERELWRPQMRKNAARNR